jgi:hypothetical protein
MGLLLVAADQKQCMYSNGLSPRPKPTWRRSAVQCHHRDKFSTWRAKTAGAHRASSFFRPTAALNCCGRVRNATWMPPSVSNGHCTAGSFSDLWRRPPTLSRAGERQRKRIACDSTATLEGFRDFVPRQDACYCRNAVTADQAPLAQLVEQLTLNQRVRGSKP